MEHRRIYIKPRGNNQNMRDRSLDAASPSWTLFVAKLRRVASDPRLSFSTPSSALSLNIPRRLLPGKVRRSDHDVHARIFVRVKLASSACIARGDSTHVGNRAVGVVVRGRALAGRCRESEFRGLVSCSSWLIQGSCRSASDFLKPLVVNFYYPAC